MTYKLLERMVWIHQQIRQGRFPNLDYIAREFEISQRSAQRTITFFKDRLLAPIAYSRQGRGYFYTDEDFDLPWEGLRQEEVLALLLAKRLLTRTGNEYVQQCLSSFSKKVIAHKGLYGLSDENIEQKFSANWNGYSPAQGEIFRLISSALIQNTSLELCYKSPASNSCSRREVQPHHLLHYMGSWVLIALCLKRGDWRKFYLSRMQEARPTGRDFAPRPRREWQYQLEDSFGIFQGRQSSPAVLRFNPFRAAWIKEQVWHPSQEMIEHQDGSLDLVLPVADYREIKMRILGFGADVEVISPEDLRLEVAREIARMQGLYPDLHDKI
jgi:predicted DNA-binding transcriptional regulator YafY